MSDNKIQLSGSTGDKDNKTIIVVGGDNPPEFVAMLDGFFSSQLPNHPDARTALLAARSALIPNAPAPAPQQPMTTQQAVQNVQATFPGAQQVPDMWAGVNASPTPPWQPQQQMQQAVPPQPQGTAQDPWAGAPQWAQPQGYQAQNAQPQYQQRQPAGPPPGQVAPLCGVHGQPAVQRQGKNGMFWSCAVPDGWKAPTNCKVPR